MAPYAKADAKRAPRASLISTFYVYKKGELRWGKGWGPAGGGLGEGKKGRGQLLLTPLPPPPIYLYTQIPLLPVINKWGERGGGWVFAKQRKGPSRMEKTLVAGQRGKSLSRTSVLSILAPHPLLLPRTFGGGGGGREG